MDVDIPRVYTAHGKIQANLIINRIRMNRNTTGVVIAVLVVAGGWYLFSTNSSIMPALTATTTQWDNGKWDSGNWDVQSGSSSVTVAYTDQGFSPASVTVAQGLAVTWVNQSSKDMWVASAMHPTHMVYDGTALKEHCAAGAEASFDACRAFAPAESYTFTFDKAGTWKYHDHIDASKFGTVIVTAAE